MPRITVCLVLDESIDDALTVLAGGTGKRSMEVRRLIAQEAHRRGVPVAPRAFAIPKPVPVIQPVRKRALRELPAPVVPRFVPSPRVLPRGGPDVDALAPPGALSVPAAVFHRARAKAGRMPLSAPQDAAGAARKVSVRASAPAIESVPQVRTMNRQLVRRKAPRVDILDGGEPVHASRPSMTPAGPRAGERLETAEARLFRPRAVGF